MRPPSQAFQLRVIVSTTPIAKRTTRIGVAYFCQAGFRCAGVRSTTLGVGAGTGDVAIKAPSAKRLVRFSLTNDPSGRITRFSVFELPRKVTKHVPRLG